MEPDLDDLLELMGDYSYDDEGEELGCEHLTILDFAEKYREYRKISEKISNTILLQFPGSVLERSDQVGLPSVGLLNVPDHSQKSPTTSTARLLTVPAEIQLAVFKCLPHYFRPQLAQSCKTLARLAQANDLLICNPVTTELLVEAVIPITTDISSVTPKHFPIIQKAPFHSWCGWCHWHGVPLTVHWFRHLRAETSRMGLQLTVGMVKHLAYECIWHRVTDPENGCRDMGEVLLDSAFMQWTEDMDDELLSPIRYQLRDVRKNVRSVSETAQLAAQPDHDSDEEDYEWWSDVEG